MAKGLKREVCGLLQGYNHGCRENCAILNIATVKTFNSKTLNFNLIKQSLSPQNFP